MKNKIPFLLTASLVFQSLSFSSSSPVPKQTGPTSPWLTGPLLSPSVRVIEEGHINFQPYVLASKSSHAYDQNWHLQHVPTFVSVQSQYQFKWGFYRDFDIQASPTFSWNHSKSQAAWVFNDLTATLGYQLVRDHPNKWMPMIKLSLSEIFPTGQYQHLDPGKRGTDAGGQGSFQTIFNLGLGKLFHLKGACWLNTRFNFSFNYLAPVYVKGINVYGGALDTDGKVYPGVQFSQIIGLELTLTQRWALALDILNIYGNKTRFSGKKGTAGNQTRSASNLIPISPNDPFPPDVLFFPEVNIGRGSFNQISLAPAIEYNWNADLGIIAGAWFTVAGRNSLDFVQWIVAFNLFH